MILIIVGYTTALTVKQGRIIDNKGRQRIFHGVNVVVKTPPYHPIIQGFNENKSFTIQDMQQLKNMGLNAIRLGVMWPGVQKKQNVWDQDYLNTMKWIVDKASQYNIMTLIQFHQDIASEKFCGDGIPVWLIDKTQNIYNKAFPLPLQTKPYQFNRTTGIPSGKQCNSHPWSNYYFTFSVAQAFHNLYKNGHNVRDKFTQYWKKVVNTFKNNSNVIAYQLINQPFAGNFYNNPLLMYPQIAQKINLQPFYDHLSNAIRDIDPDTPICFQPVTWQNTLKTGFKHPPGGKVYSNKSILCYHLYKPPAFNLSATMQARIKDAKTLGIASFLSQFWFQNIVPQQLLSLAQSNSQSWLFWGYKNFGQQGVRQIDLKLLTRTYAQAIGGKIQKQIYNSTNKQYYLQYILCNNCAQTIIYINQQLHYPNGFIYDLQPRNQLKITYLKNYFYIQNVKKSQQLEGITVSFTIKKK